MPTRAIDICEFLLLSLSFSLIKEKHLIGVTNIFRVQIWTVDSTLLDRPAWAWLPHPGTDEPMEVARVVLLSYMLEMSEMEPMTYANLNPKSFY